VTDDQSQIPFEPTTADGVEVKSGLHQDPKRPERSQLPPVRPPAKLPVPGVPTAAETKLVDPDHTRFRGRSKYRGWA